MREGINVNSQAEQDREVGGIQASYSVDRLRQIGHLVSAKKGREFSTADTHALLLLFGQELRDEIDKAVRNFIEGKLG